MRAKIVRNAPAPQNNSSPFAHTPGVTPLGVAPGAEIDDQPAETARLLDSEPPLYPQADDDFNQPAKPAAPIVPQVPRRGRPKTERTLFVERYMAENAGCTKRAAERAAEAAGLFRTPRVSTRATALETLDKHPRERKTKTPRIKTGTDRRPITISMPAEILEFFKRKGKGYQTRIIEALWAYVAAAAASEASA